jgi:hypothetical protein
MKKLLLICVAMGLVGCASSGPVEIGPDSYMISKQSAGGVFVSPSSITPELIKEGQSYCASQGKHFRIQNTEELSAIPATRMPSAKILFMCLDTNDSELNRPKLEKKVDASIAVKQDITIKQDSVIRNTGEKPAADKPKDIYQELVKLDDLRKRGILTNDEFNKQKQKILNDSEK